MHLSEICRKKQATLVAVSKTRSIEEMDVLYQLGQRVFAENKAQELIKKAPVMPPDIQWHLIGHLQTNKVKSILPYVTCIQSLDRENLWEKIQEEAFKTGRTISCLLQIKIASEETKFGWSYAALTDALAAGKQNAFPNVMLEGVMGMASLTADEGQVRAEMKQLKMYFDQLKEAYFSTRAEFKTISMGMSGDYRIALEEGSTMIRVGSLLFP
ncbi:MAG: YggS family pyridoxal phosphate-dependent enzyme [Saprospiraceae bacterium]|nr:YggS family pyridoxal phosphate-dependent enzyme [Saprospiraceae bacterium]